MTTMTLQEVQCPVCEQYTDADHLNHVGMTKELSVIVRQYISEGTFAQLLMIADMVNKRLDPSTTSMELSISNALEKFGNMFSQKMDHNMKMLGGISEKIVGPGIGEVAEIALSQELMQTFSKDEFDTSQAGKHGTDIIATVVDKKQEVGKISISIKDTKSWSNEYIQQLEKNIKHDGSKLGILISKKLPSKTNPRGEVFQPNGFMYFLVTPPYAVAIYAALRQVVITMHNTQKYIDTKEKELSQIGRISKALAKWITGNEHLEILKTLDVIRNNCEKSREELLSLQDHVERKVKKVCDKQTSTQRELLNTASLLSGLKELLEKSESGDKKIE